MTTTTSLPSRIATLAESDETEIVSGVAMADGDVTYGLEGKRKVWLAEHLQPAAQSLKGVEINPLHSEQSVGRVIDAGWDEATGAVVYKAELEDEALAEQVANNQLEVSIEARHANGGTDPNTGAMVASDVRYTGLALVQRGASPSNSVEAGTGGAEALAAQLSATQINAALDDDQERTSAAEGNAANRLAADPSASVKPGSIVTWDSQGNRPAGGTVLETIEEGRYDTELSGEAVVNAPAALIRLHRPGSDGWNRTDTTVAHKLGTLTTHDEWPERTQAASDYGFEDVPEEYVFKNPGQAKGKAEDLGLDDVHEHERDDGTVFMPGSGMGELFEALEENSELAEADEPAADGEESPGVGATSGATSDAGETETTDDATSPERGQAEASDTDSTTNTDEETASAADTDTDTDTDDPDPDADADPTDPDSDADDAASPSDSASTDSDSSTTDATDSTTDMTDEPTNNDPETDPDDPSVDELKSELADAREKKSALQEDREALEAERDELEAELEAKSEQIETAKHEYAAALADAGETLLDEDELVERFELAELAEKYDEAEEAALAADIPEEDPEPEVQSGGGGSETATLSEAERDEKRELESRLSDLEGRDSPLANAERERIENDLAELTEA